MDARVGDWMVTPRIGKPVEINALWYNALCAMTALAGRLGRQADEYNAAAERMRQSFVRFVMPAGAGLYDVIDGPPAAPTQGCGRTRSWRRACGRARWIRQPSARCCAAARKLC